MTRIDAAIPLPPIKKGRPIGTVTSFLWDMEIGDSFFATKAGTYTGRIQEVQKRRGWKFTRRAVEENGCKGFRIWRIS